MEYGTPVKLPDGRYFLKMANALHQVNGVVLVDKLTDGNISFKIPASSQEVISKCDEDILTKAKECKVEWFGKELSDETIQAAYQESMTEDMLSVAPAKLKGEVILTAYDTKKNQLELADVKQGSICDAVFELAGLWFLKKSFGPIWRVVQVRVRGATRSPVFSKEYLFTDTPEDEPETDPADYVD